MGSGSLGAEAFIRPDHFQNLGLSDFDIGTLSKDLFVGLEQVLLLYMNHGDIDNIKGDALSYLPDLQMLRLTQAGLDSVPSQLLRPNGTPLPLTHLSFHGNDLMEIPADLFKGVDTLTSLHLHDNPGSPFTYTPTMALAGDSPFDPEYLLVVILRSHSGFYPAHTPFAVTANLAVTGGEIYVGDGPPSGEGVSELTLTVPAGMYMSEMITVERLSGYRGAVIVAASGMSWAHNGDGVRGVQFETSGETFRALRPLAGPANPTAEGGDSGVALSWDADPYASSYEVQQRVEGSADWTTVDGLSFVSDANARVNVELDGLQNGVNYEHRVRCLYNESDESGGYSLQSGWTEPVEATPSPSS